MNSELSATPIDYNFSNSYLNLKGHIITGNLNLKFIGNEKILIGDVTISDIDAQKSDLPFISSAYSYIKSLGVDMHSKDYLQKFVPLRNLKLKSTLTLNLENFTADNVVFDRISAATSFDFGQIKLDDLYLHIKNKLLLKGDARLSATSIQPQIKANLSGGYINISDLPSDKLDKFLQYLQSEVNLKAFDISVEGKLDYIKFPRLNAQNIDISIDDDKNDILNFKKFNFSSLGSAVKVSGNASLNPIRVSAAFGVDSLDVSKAFEELLPSMEGIRNGRVSFSGQFSSAGDTLRNIIHNGYLNGKFISRDNLFMGVNIPSIIDGLSSVNLDKSSAMKIFGSNANSGSSLFNEIRGDYEYSGGIFSFKNVDVAADKYTISAGLAFNIYDQILDLRSIISFYPIGARIISTTSVPQVKLEMVSKGSIFGAERR